jgi:hypothetical protein
MPFEVEYGRNFVWTSAWGCAGIEGRREGLGIDEGEQRRQFGLTWSFQYCQYPRVSIRLVDLGSC